MRRSVRFWAGILAVNAAGALLANLAFGGITRQTPWSRALTSIGITFLFSTSCSSLCLVTLPRLGPRVWQRFSFPFTWAVMVAVLVALASIASLAAMLILTAIGLVPVRSLLTEWLDGPLKVSIICTLLFGIFGTVVEKLRTRLDETTIALRTKERDEAEARRLGAQAQLASLESRVQPHFLFNTLNSIAALIPRDPEGAEKMTGQLASLMRSSLDASASPLVPLEQELGVIRDYLEIERVRFGPRLRYQIAVDPQTESVAVPRLSLQTLVENSVKYAASPRREGASLVIRIRRTDRLVRLEVEDDGPGFDPSTLPNGHGLTLLQRRLAMLFGDRATLTIDSRPGRSVVRIELAES
jgi:sensor histidine kinase YesM